VRIRDFLQKEPYDPNQPPPDFGRKLGLELLPDREIATPTLVYCINIKAFQTFVNACQVKNGVRNNRVKFLWDNSDRDILRRDAPASFAHIAFVGVDPREHHRTQTYECSGVWWEIERLRQNNQFRRAFYYPEWSPGHVIPNIMEGEREW
jgi:hypothetical protein